MLSVVGGPKLQRYVMQGGHTSDYFGALQRGLYGSKTLKFTLNGPVLSCFVGLILMSWISSKFAKEGSYSTIRKFMVTKKKGPRRTWKIVSRKLFKS